VLSRGLTKASCAPFFNHPGFIEASEDRGRDALSQIHGEGAGKIFRSFTTGPQHSFVHGEFFPPTTFRQLGRSAESCLGKAGGHEPRFWCIRSRSGAPGQPWLEARHSRLSARSEGGEIWRVRLCARSPSALRLRSQEVLYDHRYGRRGQLLSTRLLCRWRAAKTVGVHPRVQLA